MNLKLSLDEHEYLEAVLDSRGYGVLLKVLDEICLEYGNKVLNYELSDGPEVLLIEKARFEGSQRLKREFKTILDKFRIKGTKSSLK